MAAERKIGHHAPKLTRLERNNIPLERAVREDAVDEEERWTLIFLTVANQPCSRLNLRRLLESNIALLRSLPEVDLNVRL
ncbi:MAG: hypothetical protein AVDCRST_MAG28-480 [uncultured Rubrobacteraceae bacterium]|uniref:Uncharacterized protein n=1 Tax=uncultured Rubrobacteraceae bacterium TaxID=349277 RepID=A0A6J4QH82_9ACTN|nr:MAG: hypothetical protein AVDCRST_MAG28-480 [uncultured Rubrobacteraceae bacterium]